MGIHKLRLVRGGLSDSYRLSGIRCRLTSSRSWSSADSPAAMVFEEDTHLILTVDKTISHSEIHPIRLMTEVLYARSHTPGSLVVKGKSWYAVVIDLDHQPICRAEWIAEAYRNIGEQISREEKSVIALHLLGAVHGRLSVSACVDWFVEAIQSWNSTTLKELWLVVPEMLKEDARKRLKSHDDN